MAEEIHKRFKVNQKKENISESLRVQGREKSESSRKSAKFQHLFYKRTKVYPESDENDNNDMLSLQDIKRLGRDLRKKSHKAENSWEMLIRAFKTDASYVNAFLEEEQSLWNLVGCLTGKDSTLQLYAEYCIVNITSVEHQYKQAVVNACSPYLITYLSSEAPLTQDLCATALGNIASDGDEFCELLKVQGIMKPLAHLFKSISPAVIEAAAFLALRLCAGNEETIEAFLAMGTGQLIVNALKKCQHESVIGQLAWLLFYIAYNEAYMKQLMELGMMDAVLYHLQQLNSSSSNNVFSLTAFLRILGNAAAIANPLLREKLSKLDLSSLIKPLLDSNHVHIVKETLWVTSNIIGIDEAIASQVMNADVLQSLGRCLNYGENIQKEVMICICTTASYGGTFLEAIEHNSQIMAKCIQFLADRNSELVMMSIQFSEMALRMQNIKMHEENRRNIKLAIEQLKNHENKDIKKTASELYDLYFGDMQQSVT